MPKSKIIDLLDEAKSADKSTKTKSKTTTKSKAKSTTKSATKTAASTKTAKTTKTVKTVGKTPAKPRKRMESVDFKSGITIYAVYGCFPARHHSLVELVATIGAGD